MKRRVFTALGCLLLATTSACVLTRKVDPGAVPKNINARFLAEALAPEVWVNRFEVESREVYASRKEIVDAVQLKPGDRVADVGAGTGLFVAPFAKAVGLLESAKSADLRAARNLLEDMRTRHPSSAEVAYDMGLAYHRLADASGGRQASRRATGLHPTPCEARRNAGPRAGGAGHDRAAPRHRVGWTCPVRPGPGRAGPSTPLERAGEQRGVSRRYARYS